MSKPTIALIPSGYKSGTVYSILPNDGTQDFNLDRDTVGTRVRKDGLIEEVVADTPRLDYTNSDCPAMLRECQRTNLVTYSEDFSQWAKQSGGTGTNPVITSNNAISPDGTQNADKVVFDKGTGTTNANLSILSTSFTSQSNTASFYIKADTPQRIVVRNSSTWLGYDIGTEWTRIEKTDTGGSLQIGLRDGYGIADVPNTATVYLWGAQLEQGVGSTSYIKTEGTIQTRDLDNLECTTTYTVGNDVTWFFDFDAFTFDNSFRALMVTRNSGFTQSMDLISYKSGSDYYIRIRATNQSALQTIIAFGEDAIQMFTRNKVAIRLYGSNFEIYVNGTREYTGTSDDGDWTLLNNSALLNDFGSTTEAPSMRLYDFRVYDQTMTQSELEELTT